MDDTQSWHDRQKCTYYIKIRMVTGHFTHNNKGKKIYLLTLFHRFRIPLSRSWLRPVEGSYHSSTFIEYLLLLTLLTSLLLSSKLWGHVILIDFSNLLRTSESGWEYLRRNSLDPMFNSWFSKFSIHQGYTSVLTLGGSISQDLERTDLRWPDLKTLWTIIRSDRLPSLFYFRQ